MPSVSALDFDLADYFALPEKRVPLSVKVPESLKEDLVQMTRAWVLLAVAKGESEEQAKRDINVTYAVERFCRVGIDGAWAQIAALVGADRRPETDAEWDALGKALLKAVKAQSK